MENRINKNALSRLIQQSKEDSEKLEYVDAALKSFEKYHAAVMADQLFPFVYSGGGMEGEQYRMQRSALDERRTIAHNALITNVRLLNRMAEAVGVEPIYDGVVSEDRPYRRLIADAVFAFISQIINDRS